MQLEPYQNLKERNRPLDGYVYAENYNKQNIIEMLSEALVSYEENKPYLRENKEWAEVKETVKTLSNGDLDDLFGSNPSKKEIRKRLLRCTHMPDHNVENHSGQRKKHNLCTHLRLAVDNMPNDERFKFVHYVCGALLGMAAMAYLGSRLSYAKGRVDGGTDVKTLYHRIVLPLVVDTVRKNDKAEILSDALPTRPDAAGVLIATDKDQRLYEYFHGPDTVPYTKRIFASMNSLERRSRPKDIEINRRISN